MLLAVALLAALAAVALLCLSRGAPHGPLQAVIVRAEPNELAAAQRAVESHGGTVGQALPVVNGFVAQVPAGSERALGATDGVAAVVLDSPMKGWADSKAKDAAATAATPGTTLSDVRQAIGADQSGATGSGVDVAVIDTGMVPVPALAGPGKVVQGPDFSDQSRDRDLAHLDTYGHGTHVAGIIAGDDPKSGFQGVAPGARLVNVKAAGADGSTSLGAIVASVGWVIAHRNDNGLHVRVLNLSFGTPPSRYQSDLLAYAVEQAWKAGIVVVVSAGNEGDNHHGLTSPAYDPFILSIGADDLSGTAAVADDVVPSWSSRGLGRNPDLVAPGRSIASLRDPNSALDLAHPEARVGDDLLKGSGTSQAAAVVSGAVALLLERRPDLSPDQVKAMVKSSADPLSGPGPDAQGAGRLNVMRALAAASPDPASVAQAFQPAAIRGIVAKLVAGLSKGRQADVGPVGPDGSSWGAGKWGGAKWGGAKWGGSSWGGSSWGGSSWGGSSWGGSSWGGSSWGGSSWGGSSWGGSSWGGSSWGDG
ncbi:MAG: S8 family serine peptidase, partial [Solirubrobacteraceae bacterium]